MGLPIIVSLVLASFWSCADLPDSDEPLTDADSPDETATSVPEAPEVRPTITQEERIAAAERSVAEIMERSRIAASTPDPEAVSISGPTHRQHLTAVQQAPSFFSWYHFSELPRERHRMSAMFNRRASERSLIGADEALYNVTLLVASRGTVHEGNFIHRPCGSGPGEFRTACDTALDHNHSEFDGPAMFAVFRHTRATGETLLGAIRRHMRYVTEQQPPIRPRSRWITELDLEGNRPAHFPATDAEGNALNWERDYLPRWLQVIEMTRRLLDGHDLGQCASAPLVTWGGRCEDAHGACDDHHGSHRGLVGMSCGDSSNRFWCRPGTAGCVESDPIPTTLEAPAEETTLPAATEELPEPVAETSAPIEGPLALAP